MSKVSNAMLVGADQPARFLVDMQGRRVRLLSADGLRVVGSFDIDDESSVAGIARLASRTSKATELLALDNPSARLVVTARVVGAEQTASRDIKLVADTAPARLHSRRDGEPRSSQNSLQLRITVSEAAYLTIVDVDAEGNVNVLFPNAYQHRDFLPGGAVRAKEEVLVPDSLQPGNRAGFHWDYGPPPGVDTVRVFAAADAATAATIRSRIGSIRPTNSQSRGEAATRSVPSDFALLRDDLTQLATRGIAVVKDESRPSSPDAAAGAPAAPGDWAAASVVVQVDE